MKYIRTWVESYYIKDWKHITFHLVSNPAPSVGERTVLCVLVQKAQRLQKFPALKTTWFSVGFVTLHNFFLWGYVCLSLFTMRRSRSCSWISLTCKLYFEYRGPQPGIRVYWQRSVRYSVKRSLGPPPRFGSICKDSWLKGRAVITFFLETLHSETFSLVSDLSWDL